MGELFKASFRAPDDIGAFVGPAGLGVSAPFPFHAVRNGICSTSSIRNCHAEEAVCPFVVHMQ